MASGSGCSHTGSRNSTACTRCGLEERAARSGTEAQVGDAGLQHLCTAPPQQQAGRLHFVAGALQVTSEPARVFLCMCIPVASSATTLATSCFPSASYPSLAAASATSHAPSHCAGAGPVSFGLPGPPAASVQLESVTSCSTAAGRGSSTLRSRQLQLQWRAAQLGPLLLQEGVAATGRRGRF